MMKILVCVKQVPDLEQIVVAEGPDGSAVLEGIAGYRTNRFDEYAVEEALRIKETHTTAGIDVLTVGPERAREVVTRALGMGAGHGVHLLTPADTEGEPAAVAAWISRYAREKGYGLIFTGSMSEDGMNGQVGPMTAGHLCLPCATQVIHLRLAEDLSRVYVEREVEGGLREKLQIQLPVVLALQSGINRPRYPSLSNLLRANRQELEIIDIESLGSPALPVARLGTALPRRTRSVSMLEGTPSEKAQQFMAILRKKAII